VESSFNVGISEEGSLNPESYTPTFNSKLLTANPNPLNLKP